MNEATQPKIIKFLYYVMNEATQPKIIIRNGVSIRRCGSPRSNVESFGEPIANRFSIVESMPKQSPKRTETAFRFGDWLVQGTGKNIL